MTGDLRAESRAGASPPTHYFHGYSFPTSQRSIAIIRPSETVLKSRSTSDPAGQLHRQVLSDVYSSMSLSQASRQLPVDSHWLARLFSPFPERSSNRRTGAKTPDERNEMETCKRSLSGSGSTVPGPEWILIRAALAFSGYFASINPKSFCNYYSTVRASGRKCWFS
jgi:hypothetical protein